MNRSLCPLSSIETSSKNSTSSGPIRFPKGEEKKKKKNGVETVSRNTVTFIFPRRSVTVCAYTEKKKSRKIIITNETLVGNARGIEIQFRYVNCSKTIILPHNYFGVIILKKKKPINTSKSCSSKDNAGAYQV